MPEREGPLDNPRVKLWPVLSIVGSIFVTAIGATWVLSGILNKIDRGLADNALHVAELAQSLEEVKGNSYTLAKASEVALREAIANPGQVKIDPRDPSKIIVVKPGSSTAVDHREPQ